MNISRKLLIAGLLGLCVLPAYGTDFRSLIATSRADIASFISAAKQAVLDKRLIWASMGGNIEGVQSLLAAGADVNTTDADGPPLLRAASNGGTDGVVAILLAAGANVDAVNKAGRTALMYAVFYGYSDVLARLIAAGANINVVDKEGKTALLMCASEPQNGNKVHFLLDHGADANVADKYGWTALIYASLYGQEDLVMRLLNAGANVNAINSQGYTALDYARAHRHTQIVEILEEAARQQARWSSERSAWIALVDRAANPDRPHGVHLGASLQEALKSDHDRFGLD